MSRLRWPNSRHSLSDVPGTVQWHLSRSLWQIPNSRKASTKTGPPVWARLLMSALTASRRTRTSACLAAGRSRSPTSSIPASPRINTAFRATNQRSSPRRSATCPTVASPILAMMRILFRIRGHRRPVQRDRSARFRRHSATALPGGAVDTQPTKRRAARPPGDGSWSPACGTIRRCSVCSCRRSAPPSVGRHTHDSGLRSWPDRARHPRVR